MYSYFIPRATSFGKISIFGGGWTLTLCRACSTSCTQTSYTIRSPRSRYCKLHSSNQSTLDHPNFQTTLYKSKYLIPKSHIASPIYHRFSQNELGLLTQNPYSAILHHHFVKPSHFLYSLQIRQFQTSSTWLKEESKLEKTVKALKDSAKETTEKGVIAEVEETTIVPAKKSLLQRFIGALKHYYHGFRLLFIDLRICSKLIWQVLNGHSLSRREYNQLVRTTADMFRLLPMLVFVLVPFAEFLLPVVLHLFPNMLPSTFKEEKDEKEKLKKKLKAKIEMAKFLQSTIKESAVEAKNKDGQTAESFAFFLNQIRGDGVKPKTKDIMKFAKLFEDEITLDNLTRQQLRACCIMLNITPMGSDALLRFLLQMKLRGLLADDKMIQKEGIETLTISELQSANRARGMQAMGVSEDRLQDQLRQWLQLHLKEQIPTSLLLLSRALYLPETLSTEEKIGATITQLAETATDEAKVKVAEMSGEVVDNKAKFEVIKREEAIIASEKEEQEKEAKITEQTEREEAEALAAETSMDAHLRLDDSARTLDASSHEILLDTAEAIQPSQRDTLEDKSQVFTTEDLDEMEIVLEEVAKAKKIDIERDALKDLKEELTEYKEDLEDLKDVAVVCGVDEKVFAESKSAKRLAKKVERMITRLDVVVEDLQEEKSIIQEKMSKEERILQDELSGDMQLMQDKIDLHRSNVININEMLDALKRLKKIPTDSKLTRIFDVLDEDKDGNINMDLALKVLELLSQEHLKLSEAQVVEMTNLLKHEAFLEIEERQKEKAEKENRAVELRKKEEQQQKEQS